MEGEPVPPCWVTPGDVLSPGVGVVEDNSRKKSECKGPGAGLAGGGRLAPPLAEARRPAPVTPRWCPRGSAGLGPKERWDGSDLWKRPAGRAGPRLPRAGAPEQDGGFAPSPEAALAAARVPRAGSGRGPSAARASGPAAPFTEATPVAWSGGCASCRVSPNCLSQRLSGPGAARQRQSRSWGLPGGPAPAQDHTSPQAWSLSAGSTPPARRWPSQTCLRAPA